MIQSNWTDNFQCKQVSLKSILYVFRYKPKKEGQTHTLEIKSGKNLPPGRGINQITCISNDFDELKHCPFDNEGTLPPLLSLKVLVLLPFYQPFIPKSIDHIITQTKRIITCTTEGVCWLNDLKTQEHTGIIFLWQLISYAIVSSVKSYINQTTDLRIVLKRL